MKSLETLILNLSTKFINLQHQDFNEAVEDALSDLGQFLGLDRAFVFLISSDGKTISNTHEWCGAGISSLREGEQNLPVNFHDWVIRQLQSFECIKIEKLSDLPEAAASLKKTLQEEEVKSTLILPLSAENRLIGLIGFDSIRKEQEWPGSFIRLLQLMANIITNALQAYQLKITNRYLQEESQAFADNEVLTHNAKLLGVIRKLYQVASTDATVLILGESGTGKELLARALHRGSKRKDEALIKVNCAALPSNLIESELFGHEKGAFTGAIGSRIGRFELAHQGTLFLDEIGELPLDLQAKLLRAIQEGELERIGSAKTIKVDVRIVAATNRNLEKMVVDGRFREDLYFRLNVFPILNPPLRERKDDIPLLAAHFTKKYAKEFGRHNLKISQKALDKLNGYHWPGNVRELQNIIERAVIVSEGNYLNLNDWLPKSSVRQQSFRPFEDHVKHYLIEVLRHTNWKISGKGSAAEILNLNPKTLESKMKKLGIAKPLLK